MPDTQHAARRPSPMTNPLQSLFTPFFLARRNMRSRRGRTLLTLLGITLGVAVVLAIRVTNQTTLDSLRRVFDRTTGQASLVIAPVNANAKAIDQALLARVEKIDGVQTAAPSLRERTLLASQSSSWQIEFNMSGIAAGSFFELYGIDPQLDAEVRVYDLSEGRMPAAGKYEVVIPTELASEESLEIGEELSLLAPNGIERLEIVGLLADEGVALLNGGAVGFAPYDVAQNLFERSGEFDEIALRLDPAISEDPRALEAFKQSLDERLGQDAEALYPAARGQTVSQMLATYQLGLTFFSLIAIFVGAFLIYNAFSMTIVERTREIGMLRAIGMNRRQVLGMVLAEAGLLSVVGSAVGLGAGVLLARGLIRLLGDLVTAEEGAVSVPWQGLAESVAVGIGVTLVAALLPALQAARIAPLEALRSRSRSGERARPLTWVSGLVLLFGGWLATYQVQWPPALLFFAGNFALICFFLGATLTVTLAVGGLERLARPLAALLYRNEGALGSANVRRSIGRTTLTVASLMVALTMIISIESLAYSFEQDMQSWIQNALGGDLYLRAPLPLRESFGRKLGGVPGVEAVTATRVLEIKVPPQGLLAGSGMDEDFYFEALDPRTFRQVGDMEFVANQGDSAANWARLEQGKAVFVSNVVADRYGLGQGDEIVLHTSRGDQAFYVAAEVVDFGGQGQVVYGTYEDLHYWFNEQGVDRFTLTVAQGYSIEAVSREIENRFQGRYNLSLQTTESFKDSILDLMEQSFRLFDVLNMIGVIIGAMGVINTLTMNVIERQREIGGLRSLGMTRGQVLRMVLAEALALGLMGGVYGLGVGYLIANALIEGTNMMVGYDLVYMFTPNPFLVGVLIALGVVQVAAIYPARRAARVNIVESIKHE
ncbi:MAG: ABC transporter permease [Anaerolineales bacterium]|nr:ABC transporter permease [Anaerolineales bacterium]